MVLDGALSHLPSLVAGEFTARSPLTRHGLGIARGYLWPGMWLGRSAKEGETFVDSGCECKGRKDLRHGDLTAFGVSDSGSSNGAR
jgi:hypothetical protein